MPNTLVTLTCAVCSNTFQRIAAEANRNQRLGRPNYCSRSCSGKGNYKNIPPETKTGAHLPKGSLSDQYSPFRTCFRVAKKRAQEYRREFDLTLDYLLELWEEQSGVCPYTGWKLRLPATTLAYNSMERLPNNASLDRIDSAGGYTKGNVQFVSIMANFAKSDFSDEQMQEFCRAIARKFKETTQ